MSVRQSLLSGAVPTWDINTGVYASKSLSVAAQTALPLGIGMSADGTKCYAVTNTVIFQYTLSTPWDISTGSYASKSLSVAAQEGAAHDISFSSDGTKAYITGGANGKIFQYTLSTAWDISTGSYASKSLSVVAQDAGPWGSTFSIDGTKVFVIGRSNKTIFQYTLSTAWDISTGSYASKSLSVVAQETSPYGLAFNISGTKIYIVGETSDTIFQYTLSTAWDISTGSYASKSLSVAAQDGTPIGLSLSPDGTKAYVIGYANNMIFQYTLI